jgi:hypothetical protein
MEPLESRPESKVDRAKEGEIALLKAPRESQKRVGVTHGKMIPIANLGSKTIFQKWIPIETAN